MNRISVISVNKIDPDEYKSFVVAQGGYWWDVDAGTIEDRSSGAAVYVFLDLDFDVSIFEEDDIVRFREALGGHPVSHVELTCSYDDHNVALANRIASLIRDTFGGIVYNNDGGSHGGQVECSNGPAC